MPLDMVAQCRNKEVKPLFDTNALASSSRVHVRSYILVPKEESREIDMSYIKSMSNIDDLIDQQNNPEIERESFKDLIKNLLRIDPNERITLDKALKHHFFDEVYNKEYEFLFDRVESTFQGLTN